MNAMEHGARRGFVTMCAEGGSVPSRLDHELAMSTYSMIDTVRLRVRYAAKQHSVMRGLEDGMDTDRPERDSSYCDEVG